MDLTFDMADIKPSVMSALTILVIVAVGVPFLKVMMGPGGRIYVPGLSELIGAI